MELPKATGTDTWTLSQVPPDTSTSRSGDVNLTEDEAYDILKHADSMADMATASSAGEGSAGTDVSWWARHGGDSDLSSWKDVFQVTWASIKASASHVESLTIESLAFGWLPLVKRHERESDHVEGQPYLDSAALYQLLHYGKWCKVIYSATTPDQLAAGLGVQVDDVAHLKSVSSALSPAYGVVVDHGCRSVVVLVRGTSQMKDLVTDLCGHSVPFFGGYAHYGMLQSARGIISAEIGRLEQLLSKHPGYQLTCAGHSLGAGIASLMAFILHNTPELNARLSGAHVHGLGFATPPCMTYDLAMGCGTYIQTVVYNNDMVPRISVMNLAALAAELDQCKEGTCQDSKLAAFLANSGVIQTSKQVVKTMVVHRALALPVAGAASLLGPTTAALAVGAGLFFGRSLLSSALNKPPDSASEAAAAAAVHTTTATATSVAVAETATAVVAAAAAAAAAITPTTPPAAARVTTTTTYASISDAGTSSTTVAASSAVTTTAAGTTTTAGTSTAATTTEPTIATALGSLARSFRSDAPDAARSAALTDLAKTVSSSSWANSVRSLGSKIKEAAAEARAAAVAAEQSQNLVFTPITPQSAPDHTSPATTSTYVQTSTNTHSEDSALPRNDGAGTGRAAATPAAAKAGPAAAGVEGGGRPLPMSSKLKILGGKLLNKVEELRLAEAASAAAAQRATSYSSEGQGSEGPPGGAASSQHEHHKLVSPGELFYIAREGADATATFRMVRGYPAQRCQRLLLKKSMLKDHYMHHYLHALERVLQTHSVYPPAANHSPAQWTGVLPSGSSAGPSTASQEGRV